MVDQDVPIGDRTLGVWVEPNQTTREALEADLEARFQIVSAFVGFDEPFPTDEVDAWYAQGRTTLIAWEPFGVWGDDILAGSYDEYLTQWNEAILAFTEQVYIRPGIEMNGSWAPWSVDNPEQLMESPEQFREVWAYLVAKMPAENIQWVFSVNELDSPADTDYPFEVYYPGPEYVDVLAFDGYNWGGSSMDAENSNGWRSHSQIFTGPYNRLRALDPTKVIWAAEVSSAEGDGEGLLADALTGVSPGIRKGQWMADLLSDTGFPDLEAVVFFSEDKERDWRLNSSPEAIAAWTDR